MWKFIVVTFCLASTWSELVGRHVQSEADTTGYPQPIRQADSLVAGIYATIDEFRQNQPSITKNYEFTGKAVYVFLPNGKRVYQTSKEVWGVCDGKDVYVKRERNFFRMLQISRWCHLEGSAVSFVPVGLIFPLPVPKTMGYLMDIEDGSFIYLDPLSLKDLLMRYAPDLAQQYKREKNRKEAILEYVRLLNLRY